MGTYDNGTGVWNIGNLNNATSATLSIVVTVNASGSYANTATISGTENDPTPGNNTSTSTPVPVNLSPVANNDSFTMSFNTTLNNNVSSNDVLQAGGNPHTFTLSNGATAAANGSLVLNTDGTFSYTPNTGFFGTVTFTYQVCNAITPQNQCDEAEVTILVLAPPVAVNDAVFTPANTPVSSDVKPNDTLPAGGAYTFTLETPPPASEGTVVMNPDGTYTFTPAPGFTGVSTFQYEVCNQIAQCSIATVTVTIGTPPVAVADSY